MQRQLTDLALTGAGAGELLEALAEAVGNPIVLEREGGGIAYRHALANPSGTCSRRGSGSRSVFRIPQRSSNVASLTCVVRPSGESSRSGSQPLSELRRRPS